MNIYLESYQNYWAQNGKAISKYLYILSFMALAFIGYLILEEKYKYLFAMIIPVALLVTITQPRWAVYQFVFLMFTNIAFMKQPVILLNDLSALILIATAIFDVLLKGSVPRSVPRLIVNFFIIIAVLFISSVFGNNMALVISPIIRISLIILTFLSLYRLSDYFEVKNLIKIFFWFAVCHAIIALTPFLTGDKITRVFGFASSTLDDYMMVAFPIGLTFYLWSDKNKGLKYLLASILVLITLIATQSRLPIIFALLLGVMVIYFSFRLNRQLLSKSSNLEGSNTLVHTRALMKKRIKFILFFIGLGILAIYLVVPDLVAAIIHRFDRLLNLTPIGTFRIRLILWQTALTAFWDNPILGIGPGYFKHVHNLYNYMHFNILFMYVKSLSAHNMFLHYLAETGLVGAAAVVALFVNQYRIGISLWKNYRIAKRYDETVILFVISTLFFYSIFIEAGWLWGQISYLFVFFITLVVYTADSLTRDKSQTEEIGE